MPGSSPARDPRRYQAASRALLDSRATVILDQVRHAFCEPTRSQIVRVLSASPLTVTEIASLVDRSKWSTSQHLRVLRDDGLVVARRRGRTIVYTLSATPAARTATQALAAVVDAAA